MNCQQNLDNATLDAVATRVGRLPLALKVIAGLLALGLTWPEIKCEMDAGHLPDIKAGNASIFTSLDTSVRFLPADEQARYRELVVFPEDVPLNVTAVARLWAKTGNVSGFVAKRLFGELRERSLIQADNTLHDLQVDYLRSVVLADDIRTLHSALCDAYAATPDPQEPTGDASPWSTLPTDDELYAWRFIATHLSQANRTADLESLLTDVTYLESKLGRLGVAATIADLALLSDIESVCMIASVIHAGTPTLIQDPRELMNQVRGREGNIPALHHLPPRPRPYFDLYTKSLTPADPALERVFVGHIGGVNDCAFSPDGHYALSGSDDQTLRLWEVATGRELHRFTGHTNSVNACAFSPDGRHILSGSRDRTLRLWELATGQEFRRFADHRRIINGCGFSSDGRYAFASTSVFGPDFYLWDIATGQEVRQFTTHGRTYALSPDGRYLLAGSIKDALLLWEVASGQEVRRFIGHTNSVNACAFSPDGHYALSGSDDQTLRLWEVASGQEAHQFTSYAVKWVEGCTFSPDGRYVISASLSDEAGTELHWWEVTSGREFRERRERALVLSPTPWITGCAFSPDGRYALASSYSDSDLTLELWQMTGGTFTQQLNFAVDSLVGWALSSDGRYAIAPSGDETFQVWDVTSQHVIRQFTGHTGKVNGCAFSPDGRYALSASDDRTLRLWNVATGEQCAVWNCEVEVLCCAFSPLDNRVVAGSRLGIHMLEIVGL